ncbi:MAG: TetR/AcrR family transcriptional regulator [Chloroflexi bacterium]|nr:TetR/AcrR family transcriptional regulator [Chloroflexota bacterium]MCH7656577.1 TetR/AcrR family transcriptional regulator [Chloroflexota bacterium]
MLIKNEHSFSFGAKHVPKVSEAHLEARKEQIVRAAFLCFARKGFHPTTMQDICAEAHLSPGALYRYFAGKEEIIQSACDEAQAAQDAGLIAEALAEPDTRAMFHRLVHAFFSRFDDPAADVYNRASLQLWAEMAVNDRVRESFSHNHAVVHAGLGEVVREAQRRGDLDGSLDPGALVSAMIALYDGFRLQKALDPTIDTAAYARVAEALLGGTSWTGAR